MQQEASRLGDSLSDPELGTAFMAIGVEHWNMLPL
jgi:hypothetical protein